LFDSYRGLTDNGDDPWLVMDDTNGQSNSGDLIGVSSTGFTLKTGSLNGSGSRYLYHAHA